MDKTTEKANKLHEEGKYEKAAKLYEKAAKSGDPYAQYSLGYMYYHGQGVAQDYKKAGDLFYKSRNHYSDSFYYEGILLKEGKLGYAADASLEMALNSFKGAAKQGHMDAQYELGFMYANGSGTNKNLPEAAQWMEKAAAQGHDEAKQWLADNSGVVNAAKAEQEAKIAVCAWCGLEGNYKNPFKPGSVAKCQCGKRFRYIDRHKTSRHEEDVAADQEARTAVCPWCNEEIICNNPCKKDEIIKHTKCGRHFRYVDRYTSNRYGMEKCEPEPGVDPAKACPQCGRDELRPFYGDNNEVICDECAFGSNPIDKREVKGIFAKIEYGNYARLLDVPCPHCGRKRQTEKPSDLGWGSANFSCGNCGKEIKFE